MKYSSNTSSAGVAPARSVFYRKAYLLFALIGLSIFTAFSCHAQPAKNSGKQVEPALVDVKAPIIAGIKYYTILMRKPESIIKSKYFSTIKSQNVKNQYEKWGVKKTVFVYSSGLNNVQSISLQIANGVIANKTIAPSGMDALVVIPPSGKISVYNLLEPVIKFKINGMDPKRSFALRIDDDQDREDFIDWAMKSKATVFQTYLLAYNDKIIAQKFKTHEKSVRRYLIGGTIENGEQVYLIVETASPLTVEDGIQKTFAMVKQFYPNHFTINYMIGLTTPSVKDAFRVNRPDGLVYDEFKHIADISDVNGLLVFYSDGKLNTLPNDNGQAGPDQNPLPRSTGDTNLATAGKNSQPVSDITDFQSLINEYTRLQSESDDQGMDSMGSPDKERLRENLINLIRKTSGGRVLNFNGVNYSIFIADLDKTEINLNLKDPNSGKNYFTLANVKHRLEEGGMKPLMITNGGMFTPAHDPQGLYIEKNSDHKFPLDSREGLAGNFYLKPNGVFYVDEKNRPHIKVTEEVQIMIDVKEFNPKIATQSGPMLVIDGKIHPMFTKGSTNLNIRSGVGVFSDDKIVFAISDAPSNFYDFAVLFRDILHCKNALYLDGAISQMYINDLNPTVPDGSFGPILSISAKK
jgi:uncharacterized protein YigE (DUF2233 family)